MALLEFPAAAAGTRSVRSDTGEFKLVRLHDVVDSITRWSAKREARFSTDIGDREIAVGDYVHADDDIELLGCRQLRDQLASHDDMIRQRQVNQITRQFVTLTAAVIHRGDTDLVQAHGRRKRGSYAGIGRTGIPKRYRRGRIGQRIRWSSRVIRCSDLNIGGDAIESAVALEGKGLKMERCHLSDRVNGDRVGGSAGLAGLNHEGADRESFFGRSIRFERRWVRPNDFIATYYESGPAELGDKFVLVSNEECKFPIEHMTSLANPHRQGRKREFRRVFAGCPNVQHASDLTVATFVDTVNGLDDDAKKADEFPD